MENYHNTPEDISNRAQGHKANLSNPSTEMTLCSRTIDTFVDN
jgi:hypothetical protein